jgi:hypothetical protein
MRVWIVAASLLLLASGAVADDAAPKSTTVGGGVANPWRSPYRITFTITTDHTLLHP